MSIIMVKMTEEINGIQVTIGVKGPVGPIGAKMIDRQLDEIMCKIRRLLEPKEAE